MFEMNRDSGLSLLEVVVAMLLLSIALLGLAVGFPSSQAAIYMGDRVSTAVNLAQQTLEQMGGRRYTETIDDITNTNFPDQDYGAIPNFLRFRRTIQIQNGVPEAVCTPPPGTPCTKTVTVTVFYRDPGGEEQSVPLTTIFIR